MRGMTAWLAAGAVVLLVIAAVYLRRDDSINETPPPPAMNVRPQPRAPAKLKERSARVEERLSELRDDVEHHRVDTVNPPPQKREVPTMAPRKLTIMNPEDAEDPETEDPQEMAELRQTLLADPDPEERI